MNSHDRLLAACLAGDLGRAVAREWDQHLLECEQCWRAVREDRAGRQAAGLLRQPAPAGLADRVAFAVELAAAGAANPRRPHRGVRPRRSWLAAAGTLALGLAVTLVVLLVPGGHASMPAPVAAVAGYAETMPPPAHQYGLGTGEQAAPVEVGHPVTMTAGGQQLWYGPGGWAAPRSPWRHQASRSRCRPVPRARPVVAWPGWRGPGSSACTASTAGHQSWWRQRSRLPNSP